VQGASAPRVENQALETDSPGGAAQRRIRCMKNNNGQYIEGNLRVRLAVFAFLGVWLVFGFLLKPIADKKIEQINTVSQQNPVTALNELSNNLFNFIIIPMSIFLIIQGAYLSRLGIKTLRTGIHPPPSVRMPFRTKIQTGTSAKVIAVGYIFAGLCNFAIIALFLMMRYEIFKHI
jgi:large-conductance mechanosensitive channel